MGGDRHSIAEAARKRIEEYDQARREVESLEELCQVK